MTEEQKDYIAKALTEIDDNYIAEAAELSSGNGRFTWRRWMTVAAACVCLIAGVGIVWDMWGSPSDKGEVVSSGCSEGVTLPKAEIDNPAQDEQQSEQPGYVRYEDRIYRSDKKVYDKLNLGSYLGKSSATDEGGGEPQQDSDYSGELAGNLYEIEGVDSSFAIALEQKKGEYVALLQDNGITLQTGSDLYEDRFHLMDNYKVVAYKPEYHWVLEYGASGPVRYVTYARNRKEIKNFITELNEGQVRLCKNVFPLEEDLEEYLSKKTTFTVEFQLNNQLRLQLYVLENGYVVYDAMPDICVQIPEEVINDWMAMQETEEITGKEDESETGENLPKTDEDSVESKTDEEVFWIEQDVELEDGTQEKVILYSDRDGSHPYMQIDNEKINLGEFSAGWYQHMEKNYLQVDDIDGDGKSEIFLLLHQGASNILTDFRMLKQNESGKWESFDLAELLELETTDVKLKVKKGSKVEVQVPAANYRKTVDVSKRAYFKDYFKEEGMKAIVDISRIFSTWSEQNHLIIQYYIYANNVGDEMGVVCQQIDWNAKKKCLELGKTWYEHSIWE